MTTFSPTTRRLYRFTAAVVILALVSSSLPLQAWSPLYGVRTVQAALKAALPRAPELANLREMGLLTADGQPNGLLLDVGALQTAEPEPASVSAPLSISRVQSAYRAADAVSSTLVITFTVTNNLPPLSSPNTPPSATITHTAKTLSAFDPLDDPNAIEKVLVADTLAASAS